MILLITPLAKAHDCVLGIQKATGEEVRVCSALQSALAELQAQAFTAVVLDQLWLDAEPDEGGAVLKHLGSAMPVYLNFAVSGTARVAREIRSALHRRNRELLAARQDAEQSLRHELKDALTALLLSCEMALRVPSLPPLAQDKMQAAEALAREMSTKLGGAA